jgi:hypothetical protein
MARQPQTNDIQYKVHFESVILQKGNRVKNPQNICDIINDQHRESNLVKYFFFCSSFPAIMIGIDPSPLDSIAVKIPVQP